METVETTPLSLSNGKYFLQTPRDVRSRFTLLLWGKPFCGKTTFAATAPGPILWINFDLDGPASLASFENIHILNLSNAEDIVVKEFKKVDPLNIGKELLAMGGKNDLGIQTVVFDSITSFGTKALHAGVIDAARFAKKDKPTDEDPGYKGYGRKNTWTNFAMRRLLELTESYNVNFIAIAHEDKAQTDRDGNVTEVSLMLGSSLKDQIPKDFSEVWHLHEVASTRRIYVRPHMHYRPCGTRMFDAEQKDYFKWIYNLDTHEGTTLEGIFASWQNAKGKIALPKP